MHLNHVGDDFYILTGKRDKWYIPEEVNMNEKAILNDKGFLRPIPSPDGLGPDRNYSEERMKDSGPDRI